MKSGNLNFMEPSGPLQASNGTALPFYLGIMVNTDNSIEEEIKERIAAGNRAYRVHKKTIFIKINIPKRQTTTL